MRSTPTKDTPRHPAWGPPARRGGDDGDARVCREIAVRHARTFSMASRLLRPAKRRAAFAIYATCRKADDIVDVGGIGGAREELEAFRDKALDAVEHQESDDAVLRELARAVRQFDVPTSALIELFDGVAMDLDPRRFLTWPELEKYCEGVAASVGEMCCAIFGVSRDDAANRAIAVAHARTLGVAMQLTNILRDVGEDAVRGRCYLPEAEMAEHGLGRSEVLDRTVTRDHAGWRSFMTFQLARARDLYRQALPGVALLDADAQRCALACASGYSRILDEIEAARFDTLTRRVSASRFTLVAVAWQSWRGQLPRFATEPATGAGSHALHRAAR